MQCVSTFSEYLKDTCRDALHASLALDYLYFLYSFGLGSEKAQAPDDASVEVLGESIV